MACQCGAAGESLTSYLCALPLDLCPAIRMGFSTKHLDPLIHPLVQIMCAQVKPILNAQGQTHKDALKDYPRAPGQFSHGSAVRNVQNVDAQRIDARGVAGRMMKALSTRATNPFAGHQYSVLNLRPKILQGGKHMTDVVGNGDVVRYQGEICEGTNGQDGVFGLPEEVVTGMLTANKSTSLFIETYASYLDHALSRSKTLGGVLEKSANQPSTNMACPPEEGGVNSQFKRVVTLIKARAELGDERQVHYAQLNGFDSHHDLGSTLNDKMPRANCGLKVLKEALVAEGLWDNVAVLTISDFGRTLTSSGIGTDHAWGGNYFLTGGKVNGGRIHGEYPDDLTAKGPLNVGRGRLIPTRGWESVWHGIAEWMGVEQDEMDSVIPNKKYFPSNLLFKATDLFRQ